LLQRLQTDGRCRFDVLAHSRGGLVLAAACRPRAGRRGRPPAVETLVHVATAKAGTAPARNDRPRDLLNTVTDIATMFPDDASVTVLDAVLEVVKDVVTGVQGGCPGSPADAQPRW